MGGPDALRLVGADGCKGGWIAVAASSHGPLRAADAVVLPDATALFAFARGSAQRAWLAIDIPIGLPASSERGRAADRSARALLGPRRSSVFPAPIRATLAFRDDYEASAAASRRAGGKALSKQAFFLLPKIAEVDAALAALPANDPLSVREVHPELAFRTLTGRPMAEPKRRFIGRLQRLRALEQNGLAPTDGSLSLERRADVAADDILDAHALLHSAARLARGEAERLPREDQAEWDPGPPEGRPLDMAIWF